MKKLLILISLILLLSGCSKEKIRGEVISVTSADPYVQLIVRTENDRQIPVLADDNTFVYSFFGSDEGLLSGDLIHPYVTVYELRKQDGGWLSARICVESIQLPDGYTLSDGTELTVRRDYHHTIYIAPDGTELLLEQEPVGPGNIHTGGVPSLSDLPENVQTAITGYYRELGLLYDLDREIDRIYHNYLETENNTEFQSRLLAQDICPAAASEKLIWFGAHVTLPREDGLHHQTSTYTIFNRETGEVVDPASLFLCTEEELARIILDLSGMPDTELRREMENAFRFDYLEFNSYALDVRFPAGSLISQNTDHILGIHYEDLAGILHPWAIPTLIQ